MPTPFHIKWAPDRHRAGPKPPPGPPELARFQTLLRELFQFDCADLDFGIYRIMNRQARGGRPLHRPGAAGCDREGP